MQDSLRLQMQTAEAREGLGSVLVMQQQYSKALQPLEEAAAIAATMGDFGRQRRVHLRMANLAKRVNEVEAAVRDGTARPKSPRKRRFFLSWTPPSPSVGNGRAPSRVPLPHQ